MSDDPQSGPDPAKVAPLRPPRPCPICQKKSRRATYPFCSRRCADLDLNRWLKGAYAIPVVEEDRGIDDDIGDD